MDSRLEERYIVFKISHLDTQQKELLRFFRERLKVPTVDCVVIEEDWPEYDPTVNLLWERINEVDD